MFRYVMTTIGVVSLLALVGISAVHLATFVMRTPPSPPDPDDAAWGVDVTRSLPASSFVRMHNLIATRTPFELGKPSSPIGDGTLNRYVGAAHATCHSTRVADLDQYDFRVCTSTEVLALSAVVPLNTSYKILTYASADGDDYEVGAVESKATYYHPNFWYNTYEDTESPPPPPSPPIGSPVVPPPAPPPPPFPLPPDVSMQVFKGSDREVTLGLILTGSNVAAHCCSGVYTHMTGEGPS